MISGYRAIVAPAALGRPITALIRRRSIASDQEAFATQLQEQAAVAEVHRTTGDATHLIKVNVPDMAALEQIVDDLSDSGRALQDDDRPVFAGAVPPDHAAGGDDGAALAPGTPPPSQRRDTADGETGAARRPRGRRPASHDRRRSIGVSHLLIANARRSD